MHPKHMLLLGSLAAEKITHSPHTPLPPHTATTPVVFVTVTITEPNLSTVTLAASYDLSRTVTVTSHVSSVETVTIEPVTSTIAVVVNAPSLSTTTVYNTHTSLFTRTNFIYTTHLRTTTTISGLRSSSSTTSYFIFDDWPPVWPPSRIQPYDRETGGGGGEGVPEVKTRAVGGHAGLSNSRRPANLLTTDDILPLTPATPTTITTPADTVTADEYVTSIEFVTVTHDGIVTVDGYEHVTTEGPAKATVSFRA